ncbi:MAG: glutamine synthetase, partial [Pseudomonadales bacterium]|nr:glutamine synthetase [Pseudomonadales bacterium]
MAQSKANLTPRSISSPEQALAIVQQRNIKHVKVGVVDLDGVIRGKYMGREKFESALEKGFGFCDVVLGWDSNDQLYENVGVKYTGWQTGYPDAPVRIIPESCREVFGEPNTLFFQAEFADQAERICPRGVLKRVLNIAHEMGYDVNAAFEYEFFLFAETPDSVREKNYQDLNPITPGFFGYSMLRSS